ncbi:Ribbon-helix-helix domain-containing protein [Bartonella apihabitans]|uniref:ribbon-helix-helix domain-containing protein n=1 Tax=Bartonella apihabitans TaxID=2750929 RepID=UPI00098EB860|nr:ribbon-helix-helix domain-containing protein [Bartonella apihabitans]AQT45196.1 Ribbon-helix-helix domain-containing protein [Bartonella apihabitans]
MKDEILSSIAALDWQKAQSKKISVRIDGHATSISLEEAYINILLREAEAQGLSFAGLVTCVDEARPTGVNLSASLRLFALKLAQHSKT